MVTTGKFNSAFMFGELDILLGRLGRTCAPLMR